MSSGERIPSPLTSPGGYWTNVKELSLYPNCESGLVTVNEKVPGLAAFVVATILVAVNDVGGLKEYPRVAPDLKFRPSTITVVLPQMRAVAGLTAVTTGGGGDIAVGTKIKPNA